MVGFIVCVRRQDVIGQVQSVAADDVDNQVGEAERAFERPDVHFETAVPVLVGSVHIQIDHADDPVVQVLLDITGGALLKIFFAAEKDDLQRPLKLHFR